VDCGERIAGGRTLNDDDLIARALQILQRRAAGEATPAITVAQLYDRYEAARKHTRGWPVVGGRLRSIRDTVYAPGIPPLGRREAMSLRVLDWSDYRSFKLSEEFAVGRRRTEWTVDCHLISLKTMLTWAVDEGRIPHNPLDRARVKSHSRREVAPDEEEIGLPLEEAEPRMRYVILAAADAGMRRNEIRLCEHGWVDHIARRIHLAGHACKGGKARSVPATRRLLSAIDALPRHVRAPWILTNPETSAPYSMSLFSRYFRVLADSVGLKHVKLHDLRHSAATNAVARGVKITAVQKMLGHANLSTTLVYVNAREDDLGPALDAIEAGIERDTRKR